MSLGAWKGDQIMRSACLDCILRLGFVAGATLLAIATSVHAQGNQGYYAGKTLTIVIGNSAGSGYDGYGRLIARFMANHLPGRPGVLAQNMPGAGGVRAADYLYNIAAKDGTVMGHFNPAALVEPLTNPATRQRYDPTRFLYIGTAVNSTRVCFTSERSKVKTFEDVQRTTAIMAATQPAAVARLVQNVAKARFQIVTGYPGPNEVFLAVERGEADGICGFDINAVTALRPGLIESGKLNMLLQIGAEASPKAWLTQRGVPQIWRYVAQEDRPLVELAVTDQIFQRSFVAPPDTPPAQAGMLRAAFEAAVREPELLEEAKRANLEIDPKPGAAVEAAVRNMYDTPKDLVARFTQMTRH